MGNHDCGPAFPRQGYYANEFNDGMSLRDYFAAQAILSIGSRCVEGLGWKLKGDLAYSKGEWKTSPQMQAEAAYRIADAMLAERQKEKL